MDSRKNRRQFIKSNIALGAGAMVWPFISCGHKSDAMKKSHNFFTVEKRNGRYWLVTPDKDYTFSIGLNHVDPAAIRYISSEGIWDSKYENSMEKWLWKVK